MRTRTNAQNDGKSFEKIMTQIGEAYDRRGVMRIVKAEPPTFRMKKNGETIIGERANPFLDYAGTWTERGGRALFIEAKSTTDSTTLPLDREGGVTTDQVLALRRWHNAGAAVAVIWEVNRTHCAAISHDLLVSTLATGRKSIRFDELPRVSVGFGFIIYDFAQLLRQFYPQK